MDDRHAISAGNHVQGPVDNNVADGVMDTVAPRISRFMEDLAGTATGADQALEIPAGRSSKHSIKATGFLIREVLQQPTSR